MSRVRKINMRPSKGNKNYFIVDACFIANKYIPLKCTPDQKEKERIRACHAWWKEIDRQLQAGLARVYIPDICIAESFKVLAKKYYVDKWFKSPSEFKTARDRLSNDISITAKELKKQCRKIKYHDLSTTRDIIISVDRFYELFMKSNKKVQLPDLIIVATAKYLMDFFDLSRSNIHIITLDKDLWSGSKRINELPNAYDPTNKSDEFGKIFLSRSTSRVR